ncbi:mechanosensitive ion channel family protein, partial [Candidatus Micrarchaeota archaeon]|nr:mechanosensitive ion channel family protein [Candidatus Micrarchaeota archaeon]
MDYYTGLLNLFDGVLYGDIILAIMFIAVSVVLAKVLYKVIEKIFKAVTSKTRLQGDIALIKKLERPIVVGIILCGIYFALITLEFIVSYRQSIDLAFTVIGVIVGTYVAIKIANVLLNLVFLNYTKVTRKALDETFVSLFGKVLSGVIIIIGLMFLFTSFGVEITPLIASLGIGGIAVALALQDTLSSFFAGTYLVTDRSIKIGDYIELENGLNGWVMGIGWRSTKIRTLPNNMVIIP